MRGSSRCVKTTRVLKRRGERPKKKDHVSIFGHFFLLDVGREKLKNKSPVLPRDEICVGKKREIGIRKYPAYTRGGLHTYTHA